jgi:predicted Rossmann fold nucleotide-binding protein DprA/Smf involved in DNA uptake
MSLSPSAQATLLLTSFFGKTKSNESRPLSIAEWGRFALWLKEQGLTPGNLLTPNVSELLSDWRDQKIGVARINQLLSRGHALALAVEKWQRSGLWIITRADPDYPMRLKSRLKTLSPPVLFGCGERRLLNDGGLAVIGSRNANDDDLAFTQKVGAKAASESISIVSGGARGVDEAGMLGALDAGGNAIGIVADSLLRAATSKKWRQALIDGRLVLVSPFYPEAGFSPGNAMARNKYIYCLAESSLVIHSGTSGGTISGAEENLKKNWVPLWVKPTQDNDAGNASLVAKGGQWCDGDIQALKMQSLFALNTHVPLREQNAQGDMFAIDYTTNEGRDGIEPPMRHDVDSLPSATTETLEPQIEEPSFEDQTVSEKQVDFYQVFIGEISRLSNGPVTTDGLATDLALQKSQVNIWLKRASDDGIVKKLNNPARYQFINTKRS